MNAKLTQFVMTAAAAALGVWLQQSYFPVVDEFSGGRKMRRR
jgi:hypothetical protein